MKKKILLGVSAVIAVVLLAGLGQYVRSRLSPHQRLYGKPRKEWKETALGTVARRATNMTWVATEIAKMRADPDKVGLWWRSQKLLLMENREWIVYTNICIKQDSRIHDLFIGRGSEGKWYYSDFHFCIEMITLEEQPKNLQDFVQTYSLREFDGRSNECLQATWDHKFHAPTAPR